MATSVPDIAELRTTLLTLEDRWLASRTLESLQVIAEDFETASNQLQTAVASNSSSCDCLHPIARRLHSLAHASLRLERDLALIDQRSHQTFAELVKDARAFITSADSSAPQSSVILRRKATLQSKTAPTSRAIASSPPPSQAPLLADTLNATFMRQWLFTHLHDPFPTKEEKERMIESTNEASRLAGEHRPLAYQQVMLWFINSRRRSGWTTFFRRFAHSDKRTVAELVRILNLEAEGRAAEEELEKVLARAHEDARSGGNKKGRASRQKAAQGYDAKKEATEAREMWAKVVDWAKQGAHEKVGDWLDKVLQEAQENGRMRKSRSSRGAEGESVRRSKRRRMEHRIKDEDEDEHEVPPLGATAPRAPLRDFSGSSFTSTLSSISSVPSLVADRTVSSTSSSGPCPPQPPPMALPIRTSISSCSDESPPTTAQWHTFEASQPISAATLEPTRSFAPSPSSSASSNGESESGWSISQLDPSALVPPYTALDKGKARETHFQQQEEMTFTPAISNPFMDFSFDFSCVPRADTGYALAQTTWVPFMG